MLSKARDISFYQIQSIHQWLKTSAKIWLTIYICTTKWFVRNCLALELFFVKKKTEKFFTFGGSRNIVKLLWVWTIGPATSQMVIMLSWKIF